MTDLERKKVIFIWCFIWSIKVLVATEKYTLGYVVFSAMITSFQAKVNDLQENAPFCSNECMYISHGTLYYF